MTLEFTNIVIGNEIEPTIIEMTFDIMRGEDGKDGVGGITDAPSDGNIWARQNGEWVIVQQPDLTNYYTKEETNDLLTTVYKFKGSVNYFADLPTDAQGGDVYNVLYNDDDSESGMNYAFNENLNSWDSLGGLVGLATLTGNGLLSKEDFAALVALKVHLHVGQVVNPDGVTFGKSYTDVEAESLPIGTIFYNSDQRCLLLKLSSVNYYNFGEELPVLSRNADAVTHLEGQACFISGGSTQLNNVSLASSATGKINCLATQDVLTTGEKTGYYCYFGQVRKFPYANVIKSTDNASTWVDGADLYLCSEAGKYSTVKEVAPSKASYVGRITNRTGANITVMFLPAEIKATTDLSDWDGSTNAFADAEKIMIRKTNGVIQEITKADFYAVLDDYFAKLSGGNDFADTQNFEGRINHKIGEKFYCASSKTSDTVNDIRTFNNAGAEIKEVCTVASSTKGGGTWIRAVSIGSSASTKLDVNGDIKMPNNSIIKIGDPTTYLNFGRRSFIQNLIDNDNAYSGLSIRWGSKSYSQQSGPELSMTDPGCRVNLFSNTSNKPASFTIGNYLNNIDQSLLFVGGTTDYGSTIAHDLNKIDSQLNNLSINAYDFIALSLKNLTYLMISNVGDISTLAGKYQYQSASPTEDTVNDIRTFNNAGVFTIQKCTVASASKGGGTWVTTFTS